MEFVKIKTWDILRKMLIVLWFVVMTASADEPARAAREIINKWQDVVITVKIVIEMQEYENKTEAFATIIDSSGLAVLSLSMVDPGSMTWSDMPDTRIASKIKDIKMIMSDGNEAPAKIVLRDEDLDLVFIQPTEKSIKSLPALDLKNNAKIDIMDQIVILARLGEVTGYVPTASLCRIQAIVKKPRTFYLSDFTEALSGLGAPAFSLDGKVVGILLLRIAKSKTISANIFSAMGGMMPIILPAEEVLDVAEKIPNAKSEDGDK